MKPIDSMTFDELCDEAAKHPGGDVLVKARRERISIASCNPCETNKAINVLRGWLKTKN